jgi:hypothetical protein
MNGAAAAGFIALAILLGVVVIATLATVAVAVHREDRRYSVRRGTWSPGSRRDTPDRIRQHGVALSAARLGRAVSARPR